MSEVVFPPEAEAVADLDYVADPNLPDTPVTEAVEEPPTIVEEPPVAKRIAQKTVQTDSYHHEKKVTDGEVLTLPSDFEKETRQLLEKIPNVDMLDSPDARRWAEGINQGLGNATFGGAFVEALEDQDASFGQMLEHNNIKLQAGSPRQPAIENQNLKGERAVIRVLRHLGLGTLFQAPMWHSGFWVTFKPPTDSDMVELNRILNSDKIRLGRNSYGMVFSNVSSYTVDRLVDFAIQHVYDTSVKKEDLNIENLKQHLSAQDIPTFIWAFACTMYPNGFKYNRSCVSNPEKCNYVLEETLNLFKLQWVNKNAFTDWQKTFMSSRQSASRDLGSVQRYREETARAQKRRIEIKKDGEVVLAMTLRTPSVQEYVEAGHRWIGEIADNIEKALGTDAGDRERNTAIVRSGQATAMRQYTHWLDSLEYDTNIVDDKETIEKLLDVLSADDIIRKEFTKAVVDYINGSVVSVIGIPTFDCPKCEAEQKSGLDMAHFVNVIPLDVIQLFFSLHIQRIERITTR